jgi:hypothetical protein
MSEKIKNVIFSSQTLGKLGIVIGLFFSTQSNDIALNRPLLFGISILFFLLYLILAVSISKNFLIVTSIYLAYVFIQIYLLRSVSMRFIFAQFTFILFAFAVLRLVKDSMFKTLERLIFILTVISLLFYPFYVVFPNHLFDLINSIQALLHIPVTQDHKDFLATILIYSLRHFPGGGIPRNLGFCFEPGLFAVMILIGMICNALVNGTKINTRFFVYLIALFTTQSTTGMLGLIIIILYYYYNNHKRISWPVRIFIISVSLFSIFAIFKLPFVYNKTLGALYNVKAGATDRANLVSDKKIDKLDLDRLESTYYAVVYIIPDKPLFGVAWSREEAYASGLTLANGMVSFTVYFGLILLCMNLVLLYYSIKFINKKLFLKSHGVLIFIIFLIAMFSYGIFNYPIYYFILFYSIFATSSQGKKWIFLYGNKNIEPNQAAIIS